MAEKNEPQSYGSQSEWVRGETGGHVSDQKSEPKPQHSDFYGDRRESEENGEHQGGHVSPVQAADTPPHGGGAPVADDEQPVKKVTSQEAGAPVSSWFRKRDYE